MLMLTQNRFDLTTAQIDLE